MEAMVIGEFSDQEWEFGSGESANAPVLLEDLGSWTLNPITGTLLRTAAELAAARVAVEQGIVWAEFADRDPQKRVTDGWLQAWAGLAGIDPSVELHAVYNGERVVVVAPKALGLPARMRSLRAWRMHLVDGHWLRLPVGEVAAGQFGWSVPSRRWQELAQVLIVHYPAAVRVAALPEVDGVSLSLSAGGAVVVDSRYNADLVALCKRWSGVWDGETRTWTVPAHRADQFLAALVAMFPEGLPASSGYRRPTQPRRRWYR